MIREIVYCLLVCSFLYGKVYGTVDCTGTVVDASKLRYVLYNDQYPLGINITAQNSNLIDYTKKVAVFIHGWLQYISNPPIVNLKDVMRSATGNNVILFDWSYYGYNYDYFQTYCAVPQVGKILGDFIFQLSGGTTNLPLFVVIAFSIGSHVGGFAGKQIQTYGTQLNVIYGLDPAAILYSESEPQLRLTSTDAVYVEIIHTNADFFGVSFACGTVDIWVNYVPLVGCGTLQNGCPISSLTTTIGGDTASTVLRIFFCNHVRALLLFTESITTNQFIAIGCTSCTNFVLSQCVSSQTRVMGYQGYVQGNPSGTGSYYLTTNPLPPFARGIAGTQALPPPPLI